MANKANRIRIIAGRWRGRKSRPPHPEPARPSRRSTDFRAP